MVGIPASVVTSVTGGGITVVTTPGKVVTTPGCVKVVGVPGSVKVTLNVKSDSETLVRVFVIVVNEPNIEVVISSIRVRVTEIELVDNEVTVSRSVMRDVLREVETVVKLLVSIMVVGTSRTTVDKLVDTSVMKADSSQHNSSILYQYCSVACISKEAR